MTIWAELGQYFRANMHSKKFRRFNRLRRLIWTHQHFLWRHLLSLSVHVLWVLESCTGAVHHTHPHPFPQISNPSRFRNHHFRTHPVLADLVPAPVAAANKHNTVCTTIAYNDTHLVATKSLKPNTASQKITLHISALKKKSRRYSRSQYLQSVSFLKKSQLLNL